jgi:hypothetical protein
MDLILLLEKRQYFCEEPSNQMYLVFVFSSHLGVLCVGYVPVFYYMYVLWSDAYLVRLGLRRKKSFVGEN